MSIEKDIHQSKFKSEYQKSVINIIYTYNWTRERLQQIFDRENLTPQQFNILRILRGSAAPLSTLQIRERMLDRMSDTSRIVDRLLAKQLVKKVICNKDRRLVDVTITDKGQALLKKLDVQVKRIDEILNNITPKEAETVSNLLDKLRDGSKK